LPPDFIVGFLSDSSISDDGFVLQWDCGTNTDVVTEEVPLTFGTEGTIRLEDYGNNHYQTWDVQSQCDHVLITSEFFQTEENFDVLTIDSVSYRRGFRILEIEFLVEKI